MYRMENPFLHVPVVQCSFEEEDPNAAAAAGGPPRVVAGMSRMHDEDVQQWAASNERGDTSSSPMSSGSGGSSRLMALYHISSTTSNNQGRRVQQWGRNTTVQERKTPTHTHNDTSLARTEDMDMPVVENDISWGWDSASNSNKTPTMTARVTPSNNSTTNQQRAVHFQRQQHLLLRKSTPAWHTRQWHEPADTPRTRQIPPYRHNGGVTNDRVTPILRPARVVASAPAAGKDRNRNRNSSRHMSPAVRDVLMYKDRVIERHRRVTVAYKQLAESRGPVTANLKQHDVPVELAQTADTKPKEVPLAFHRQSTRAREQLHQQGSWVNVESVPAGTPHSSGTHTQLPLFGHGHPSTPAISAIHSDDTLVQPQQHEESFVWRADHRGRTVQSQTQQRIHASSAPYYEDVYTASQHALVGVRRAAPRFGCVDKQDKPAVMQQQALNDGGVNGDGVTSTGIDMVRVLSMSQPPVVNHTVPIDEDGNGGCVENKESTVIMVDSATQHSYGTMDGSRARVGIRRRSTDIQDQTAVSSSSFASSSASVSSVSGISVANMKEKVRKGRRRKRVRRLAAASLHSTETGDRSVHTEPCNTSVAHASSNGDVERIVAVANHTLLRSARKLQRYKDMAVAQDENDDIEPSHSGKDRDGAMSADESDATATLLVGDNLQSKPNAGSYSSQHVVEELAASLKQSREDNAHLREALLVSQQQARHGGGSMLPEEQVSASQRRDESCMPNDNLQISGAGVSDTASSVGTDDGSRDSVSNDVLPPEPQPVAKKVKHVLPILSPDKRRKAWLRHADALQSRKLAMNGATKPAKQSVNMRRRRSSTVFAVPDSSSTTSFEKPVVSGGKKSAAKAVFAPDAAGSATSSVIGAAEDMVPGTQERIEDRERKGAAAAAVRALAALAYLNSNSNTSDEVAQRILRLAAGDSVARLAIQAPMSPALMTDRPDNDGDTSSCLSSEVIDTDVKLQKTMHVASVDLESVEYRELRDRITLLEDALAQQQRPRQQVAEESATLQLELPGAEAKLEKKDVKSGSRIVQFNSTQRSLSPVFEDMARGSVLPNPTSAPVTPSKEKGAPETPSSVFTGKQGLHLQLLGDGVSARFFYRVFTGITVVRKSRGFLWWDASRLGGGGLGSLFFVPDSTSKSGSVPPLKMRLRGVSDIVLGKMHPVLRGRVAAAERSDSCLSIMCSRRLREAMLVAHARGRLDDSRPPVTAMHVAFDDAQVTRRVLSALQAILSSGRRVKRGVLSAHKRRPGTLPPRVPLASSPSSARQLKQISATKPQSSAASPSSTGNDERENGADAAQRLRHQERRGLSLPVQQTNTALHAHGGISAMRSASTMAYTSGQHNQLLRDTSPFVNVVERSFSLKDGNKGNMGTQTPAAPQTSSRAVGIDSMECDVAGPPEASEVDKRVEVGAFVQKDTIIRDQQSSINASTVENDSSKNVSGKSDFDKEVPSALQMGRGASLGEKKESEGPEEFGVSDFETENDSSGRGTKTRLASANRRDANIQSLLKVRKAVKRHGAYLIGSDTSSVSAIEATSGNKDGDAATSPAAAAAHASVDRILKKQGHTQKRKGKQKKREDFVASKSEAETSRPDNNSGDTSSSSMDDSSSSSESYASFVAKVAKQRRKRSRDARAKAFRESDGRHVRGDLSSGRRSVDKRGARRERSRPRQGGSRPASGERERTRKYRASVRGRAQVTRMTNGNGGKGNNIMTSEDVVHGARTSRGYSAESEVGSVLRDLEKYMN